MRVSEEEEAVATILNRLATASDAEKKEILETVAPILSSHGARIKYKAQLEKLDLNCVFNCVNDNNPDTIEVAADVIKNVLDFVDPNVTLDKYSGSLQQCLDHPNPLAKSAALHFLNTSGNWNDEAINSLKNNKELLVSVAKSIISEDLNVAKESKVVFRNLSKREPSFIFQQPLLPLFQEMSKHENEIMRMRIFEFVVDICKMSKENMKLGSDHGFLQALCDELDNKDDVLLQLNVLEILVGLAESPDGYLFLEEQHRLRHLDNLLIDCVNTPTGSLLLPGFIKFFGRIASNKPVEFSDKFPNFTNTLFNLLSSGDEQVMGDEELKRLAIATVGHISLSMNGKRELNKLFGEQLLNILVDSIVRGSVDQKLTALRAISDMLSTKHCNPEAEESSQLTENFFKLMVEKGISIRNYFDMIKQPFADISKAAYDVIMNMADKEWGLKMVVGHPGLPEFLLDRSTAISKEAKDVKYELLKIMVDNPTSTKVVPPELLTKIKLYVKEGPYYLEPQVEVALDEG